MSKELFSLLTSHAFKEGVVIADSEKGRYIERKSDDDAVLMSTADVENIRIGRDVHIIKIKDNSDFYFCIFGLPPPDEIPDGITFIKLTPALFSVSVLASNIKPLASGNAIKDAIEFDYVGRAGYNGHELEMIAPLFPPAIVCKGSNNSVFHLNLHRVFGAFYCKTSLDRPIDLEPLTLSELASFFEGASKFIPFANIARGLAASSYEGLFLETYRCLEQLYSCAKVNNLRENWASNQSLRTLAALLENHLGWRPKEDDALLLMLQRCNLSTVKAVCATLDLPVEKNEVIDGVTEIRPKTDLELVKTAATGVYTLRNQLVHYRPVHEIPHKSDASWNELIRLMLIIVKESYSVFGEVFFDDLPPAPPAPMALATFTTPCEKTAISDAAKDEIISSYSIPNVSMAGSISATSKLLFFSAVTWMIVAWRKMK